MQKSIVSLHSLSPPQKKTNETKQKKHGFIFFFNKYLHFLKEFFFSTISSQFVDPGCHSSGLNASACPGAVGSRGASAEVHRAAGHCSHHQPHRTVPLHPGRAEVRSSLGNCCSVSYCWIIWNFESWVSTVICISVGLLCSSHNARPF